MYCMHTFVASKCMHVIHSGGFRFNGGFGYMYLTTSDQVPCIYYLVHNVCGPILGTILTIELNWDFSNLVSNT